MTDRAGTLDGQLAHLASFPEQNPNPVIELDAAGNVAYINPEGAARFPDLRARGRDHPLLEGLIELEASLQGTGRAFVAREIDLGDAVFEQKVCPIGDQHGMGLRIFVHDVTDLRRAHQAIRQLARRVMDAQEEERSRISRELHDDAGQALTALRIALDLLADRPPEGAPELHHELDRIRNMVDDTQDRIRRLALGLRPSLLDVLAISDALRAECDRFTSQTGLTARCEGQLPDDMTGAAATAVYRLVQEGLNNIARHADADSASVVLADDQGSARVEVGDDGQGFDVAAAKVKPGIGLRGLEERFALLGGTFTVHSTIGEGTLLVGSLPPVSTGDDGP